MKKSIVTMFAVPLAFVAFIGALLFWSIFWKILVGAVALIFGVAVVYVIYRFSITCPHCGEVWRHGKWKKGARCPSCGKTRKGK